MNKLNRNLLISFVLLVIYFISCWVVDIMSSTTVMSSSGRNYNVEYHLFHNEYIFYNQNTIDYKERILKFDRIFLLGTAIVFFVIVLINKFKKNK